MPSFQGVNHFALTVTDLDASEHFYTQVLGFITVLDFGYGRVCLHKASGFTIALIRHPGATGEAFTELNTGIDHIGLTAADREELVAWEDRLRVMGVSYTPIREMALGYHLNFRDPDGIAMEFYVPNDTYAAALAEIRTRDVPDEVVRDMAVQLVGADVVVGRSTTDRSD